jgi:hypothetical protein
MVTGYHVPHMASPGRAAGQEQRRETGKRPRFSDPHALTKLKKQGQKRTLSAVFCSCLPPKPQFLGNLRRSDPEYEYERPWTLPCLASS